MMVTPPLGRLLPRRRCVSHVCAVGLFSLLPLAVPAQQGVASPPSIAPLPVVTGSISGSVADSNGAPVANAQVVLASDGASGQRQNATDSQGHFSFNNVATGHFVLTISAEGMATASVQGVLRGGEAFQPPTVVLRLTSSSEVSVTVSQYEMAETELKQEEQQRLFGFAPNFYVTYDWHASPMTPGQKFRLADRTLIDPVNIGIVAAFAGLNQANNTYSGFGQGAQGYAKRFGAGYADFAIGTMLTGAILPTLFKQDPRYFVMGKGPKGDATKTHRALYALATSVIQKGDNGKWQPAYSNVIGTFGAAGISNAYYPAVNRNGAGLTIANGFLGLAFTGVGNLLQEFVFRKLSTGTSKTP